MPSNADQLKRSVQTENLCKRK